MLLPPRRHYLSFLALFIIACGSDLPRRGCGCEAAEVPPPKAISERFNTVAVGDKASMVHGTVVPHPQPVVPKLVPVTPTGGKEDFVQPLHPEVKPSVVVGHADPSIHPIPNNIVYPTRLPLTQKPIVA